MKRDECVFSDFNYGLKKGVRDTTEILDSIVEHNVDFEGFLRLLPRSLENGIERLYVRSRGITKEVDHITLLYHPPRSFGESLPAINNTLPSSSLRSSPSVMASAIFSYKNPSPKRVSLMEQSPS